MANKNFEMNPFGAPPNFFNGQQNVPQNLVFNPNLPPPPLQVQNFQPQNGNGFSSFTGFNNKLPGAQFNNTYTNNFNNQFPPNFRSGSLNNFRNGSPMTNSWSQQNQFQQNQNPRNGRAVNNIWSQPQDHQVSDEKFYNKNRQNHGHGGNGPFKNRWQSHGNKNYNQNNKNKKVKVDKRDLPENNAFYCDACDRGFKTEQIYAEHVSLHEKCSGCSYVAAPKLVKLHYDLQHRTGLAKKIGSMETKEDLQKWISERKKNYPTASNIARKNQVLQEKKDRGEILETKQFGKMKGRGRRERNMKRKADSETKTTDVKRIKEEPVLDHPDPMSMLLTQQPKETNNNGAEKAEVKPLNGLTCLMACYGGEDSDSDTSEKDNTTNIESTPNVADIKSEATEAHEDVDSDSENSKDHDDDVDDVKEEKEEDKNVKNNKRKRKRGRRQKNSQTQATSDDKQTRKNQSTLLEMLLAKEIRHERNVILQCVHYIVKKNFFNRNSN